MSRLSGFRRGSKGIEDVRLIDYKWLESFNVISLQKRLLVGKSKERNVFIYLRLYDEKRYDRGCRNCLFMSHPGGLWRCDENLCASHTKLSSLEFFIFTFSSSSPKQLSFYLECFTTFVSPPVFLLFMQLQPAYSSTQTMKASGFHIKFMEHHRWWFR